MAIEEHKDIKRIDSHEAESMLVNRQLGFVQSADSGGGYKMKYRTVNDEVIEFTPDHGNPKFNSVTLTEVTNAAHAVTKKYVDDAIKENDIATVRPHLNGFVHPERLQLEFFEFESSIKFTSTKEDGSTEDRVGYFVKGRKYELSTTLRHAVNVGNDGFNFVFLRNDSSFVTVSSWEDAEAGWLPILVAYREVEEDAAGNKVGSKLISVTPDYHGTTMDGSTRHFVNANNGLWIEWGLGHNSRNDKSIEREEGEVSNEDVSYHIPALNDVDNSLSVKPAVWCMTNSIWGEEEFKEYTGHGVPAWLSHLSSESFTLYQAEGELRSGVDGNYGGWFLYFAKPDLRSDLYVNDVFVPLTISKKYEDRYSGLDASVREVCNHYKNLICDWKVLGLIYIQGGAFREYLNIANFELKDLLYGDLIETFATQNSLSRFCDLEDTPSYSSPEGYSEYNSRVPKVKSDGTGLEFTTVAYVSSADEFKRVAENATEYLSIQVTKEITLDSLVMVKNSLTICGETITFLPGIEFEVSHWEDYADITFYNDVTISADLINSRGISFRFRRVFLTTNSHIALQHEYGNMQPALYENTISGIFRLEGDVVKQNWSKTVNSTLSFDNHNLSIDSANPTRISPMFIYGTPMKIGRSMAEYLAIETGSTTLERDTTLYLEGFVREGSPGNITNLTLSKSGESPSTAVVYVKELINNYGSDMIITVEAGVTLYWERKSERVIFHSNSQGTIEQKWWSRNEIASPDECEKAGVIEISENGKTGYCLKNDIRELKQPIGQDAIDLSSVVKG